MFMPYNKKPKLSKVVVPFDTSTPRSVGDPGISYPCQHLMLSVLLVLATLYPSAYGMVSGRSISISLMTEMLSTLVCSYWLFVDPFL